MKRSRKILIAVAAVVGILAIAAAVYINDYSRPLDEAREIADQMENRDGNLYAYGDSGVGFILYPGGKVDEAAYAPLARMLNEAGHTVVIVKMPIRLAIMGSGRAEAVIEENPEVTSWYMIGHSLGGTAMSMYAEGNPEGVDGLVFLASYPYRDLTDYSGQVLTIYASEDGVLNWEAAEDSADYYPEGAAFHTIEGGNHAGFGVYGDQSGDNPASITWEDQHEETVRQILALLPEE